MSTLWRRLKSLVDHSPEPSEEAPSEPSPEPRQLNHVDLSELPRLFATGQRDDVDLALGHLVGAPELSRQLAEELVDVLLGLLVEREPHEEVLGRSAVSSPRRRRAGYRGLRRIAVEHPSLVTPHARSLTDGLRDYHLQVRRACAELFVVLLKQHPEHASLVYPALQERPENIQLVALDVLVETAETRPVVLAPLARYLLDEVEDPSLDRELVARAVGHLGRIDPETRDEAAGPLIDWLPTTAERIETAVIRVLVEYEPRDREARIELAESLLESLEGTERELRTALVERLLAEARTDPAVEATVDEWIAGRDAASRRRIRAWIDEAEA